MVSKYPTRVYDWNAHRRADDAAIGVQRKFLRTPLHRYDKGTGDNRSEGDTHSPNDVIVEPAQTDMSDEDPVDVVPDEGSDKSGRSTTSGVSGAGSEDPDKIENKLVLTGEFEDDYDSDAVEIYDGHFTYYRWVVQVSWCRLRFAGKRVRKRSAGRSCERRALITSSAGCSMYAC